MQVTISSTSSVLKGATITNVSLQYYISASKDEPTGGTWSDTKLTPTGSNPYLWTRHKYLYSTGTIIYDTPVLKEDYQVFELTVSPNNIIKNLRNTNTQNITLSAQVNGYSDYTINYMFNGSFIGDTFVRATSQTTGGTYYTFAQTSDTTVQSGKTYYTRSGTTESNYIYTECVNLTAFVGSSTNYYERTTVSYSSGVYEQDFYAHIAKINHQIPYINNYENEVVVSLYNGATLMDSVSVSVIDNTEYVKCVGVMDSNSTAFPQTTTDGQVVINGDVVVFSVTKTISGTSYTAGSVCYYSNGSWIKTQVKEKTAEKLLALQALIEKGVDLSTLNETSVIQWFSEIVATSITAEYIGAKEIQIQDGGSIRGGDYEADGTIPSTVTDPTGFHISSKGKLQATNAYFERITIDKNSVLNGNLECGNAGDIMIKTKFENEGSMIYFAQNGTTPDGFRWSEVNTYLTSLIGTPSTTPWNSTSDTNTLCPLVVKKASGKVNAKDVDSVVYTSDPVLEITAYSSRAINKSSSTAEKVVTLTNPLPCPVTLSYHHIRGIAYWTSVFDSGHMATATYYQITHADGSTEPEVQIAYYGSHYTDTVFDGTITMLAGDTITWRYGYLGSPSSSWNNGRITSELTLSISLDLSSGFNFYYNGTRSLMPTSGYSDSTDGMNALKWGATTSSLTSILNLPHTTASWATGINKYFKFAHTLDSSATFTEHSFSNFSSITSLYITDENNVTHGSASPTVLYISLISVVTNECSFTYNSDHFSILKNGWTRGFYISFTAPSSSKGVYTASLFPRLTSAGTPVSTPVEEIGSGSNKYKTVYAKTGAFETAEATTGNITTVNATTVDTTNLETDSATTLITHNDNSTRRTIGMGIIKSYINGTSGWRIWADGYCEQWGQTTITNNNQPTVALLKDFADTNYNISIGATTTAYAYIACSAFAITYKSFQLSYAQSTSGMSGTAHWIARGYLANGQY